MRAVKGGQYIPSRLTYLTNYLTVHVPEAGPFDVATVQSRLVANNNHADMLLTQVPQS
jgi:hypothetical protein